MRPEFIIVICALFGFPYAFWYSYPVVFSPNKTDQETVPKPGPYGIGRTLEEEISFFKELYATDKLSLVDFEKAVSKILGA